MDPLVAGIEAAGMTGHGNEAGLFLHLVYAPGIGQVIGDGDLDLHMLARLHDLYRLVGVHLRGRGEDGGVYARLRQGLAQVGGPVRDAVFPGDLGGGIGAAAGDGSHFHTCNILQAVQVFLGKCTLTYHTNLHQTPPRSVCRWIWLRGRAV